MNDKKETSQVSSGITFSGQIGSFEDFKTKSHEELWMVFQGLWIEIFQLNEQLLVKDEEITKLNLELKNYYIQIRNIDELTRKIQELQDERDALLKRVEEQDNHIKTLELTVQNHETLIQQHSETIENLQITLSPLTTLQHSLSARQIAADANLSAIENIFPGGTSPPYFLKSAHQLRKFLKGDDDAAAFDAFDAWNLKSGDEQNDVKEKLKKFLVNNKNFLYYSKFLKKTDNSSAHTIVGGAREYYESVGDSEVVKAIDYFSLEVIY